ncbi:NAD(P)-dependent oxidoreductase [Acinetobacter bereziniae]|uniref:NAD(P)-dependent oxidoreductase n=2 Tax=Acinetobacter bereziniae TaxID=106648 RepID=UPI001580967E|nr:NAD(P)-dependent oxidoreductase [Acinetobacter bereziniae]NUF65059.1 NAD(P)-dependent oxidoreductase [Acinetobacter bereziniae]NUG65771.1 NAD(P)-dependent oxidoreductase [Acinetobacter bereziniae]NUG71498.1 NAD(P)-dependent oxidoreductase [Acinetobacter bereziniae]NUG80880.1 NAD(P)-dependent oxidoreductase [Acinetobacter bereziniae]WEI21451.1 NAD(P)-dependent oxidoreductase [Acinetobacter bereziniae]
MSNNIKDSELPHVAFIGLGAMGWHMASHLPKVCKTVKVWNRNFEKAQQHAQSFGTIAVNLQEAVQADIIFSCLPTSADVENLIARVSLKAGSIWVDCTSGIPSSACRLAEKLKKLNIDYLDAPVSGQTIGAENGTLTVMLAGDYDACLRAKPFIQAFADLIEYVGESGSGFAVKAVNNSLMAVNLWAAAEGLSILKAQQVDLAAALNCINHSSGRSGMSETIVAQRILNGAFDRSFALNLLQKDMGIAIDLMRRSQLELQVLQTTHACYDLIKTTDAASMDFSAAIQRLEQDTGYKLRF